MSEFTKYDDGKEPMHLLPWSALSAVAHVLAYGAKKYAPDNWRGVDDRRRYYDAALRHLMQWNDSEGAELDESGHSHLAHAACSVLFLLACEQEDLG